MKNFEELDNCDAVLLCTSTDMETILGLVCGVYSSIFLDTDSVEEAGKNPLDFL